MFKLCFSSINLTFPVLRDVGTFFWFLHKICGPYALSHNTSGPSENSWKSFLCKNTNQWWNYTWKEPKNTCLSLSYKPNVYAAKLVFSFFRAFRIFKMPSITPETWRVQREVLVKREWNQDKRFYFFKFFKNIIQFKHISRSLSGINHSLGT